MNSENTNYKFCEYCGNSKPAIGNQRKNGKTFYNNSNNSNDWKNESHRKYCKTCTSKIRENITNIYCNNFYDLNEEDNLKRIKKEKQQYENMLERIKNKHIQERTPIDTKLLNVGDTIQFKKLASYKNYHYGTIIKINTKTIKIKTEKYECNVKLNLIKKPS